MASSTAAPSLDPFDPAKLAAPYPLYERLRSLGPAVHLESRDIWLVSTYDAVRHVLRTPAQFLSGLGTGYVRAEVSGVRGPLIDNDPPDHTRIRRSVQRWFTPSAIEERRAAIRNSVEALVDDALRHKRVDGVRHFARPLPVTVMGDLLGLDHPDPTEVSDVMDAVFHAFGPEPAAHMPKLGQMIMWLIEEGVPGLREDALGQAIMSGTGDMAERLGLIASIWSAGIDTSTNLIGSALHAFASSPDQWKLLVEDPSLAAAAVEEALRYESPIRFFMRRTAAKTDLLGVDLPAGADVCALFPSANRDPDHYEDPDSFIVPRNPTDHLAFGSGIHLCLGAPLSRLEAGELFRCLAERVRTIELDGDSVRNPSPVIQGFLALPLRLSA